MAGEKAFFAACCHRQREGKILLAMIINNATGKEWWDLDSQDTCLASHGLCNWLLLTLLSLSAIHYLQKQLLTLPAIIVVGYSCKVCQSGVMAVMGTYLAGARSFLTVSGDIVAWCMCHLVLSLLLVMLHTGDPWTKLSHHCGSVCALPVVLSLSSL